MKEQFSTIEDLLADESFQRWISKKASAEEERKWSDWLSADTRHKEIYEDALKLRQLTRFRPESLPNVALEWATLQQRLAHGQKKRASILHLSFHDVFSRNLYRMQESWQRYVTLAAAAVLIVFLMWQYLPRAKQSNPAFQTISTEYGQRVRIILPEGTRIVLNAHSTLRYPSNWTKNTARKLDLHGEAYFTVTSQAKGPQHDFIVKTVDGEVKVIGTRFAVYERGRGTRVVVEKGCVKVLAAPDTGRSNRTFSASAFLRPGYLLQFSRGNQSLRPQAVNVKVYTSWRDDEFVFDHTPFRDIVRRIEETYGVHIKVSDKNLLKRSLSGSIENSSLQIITTALAKALQIPVHYEGKNIIFG